MEFHIIEGSSLKVLQVYLFHFICDSRQFFFVISFGKVDVATKSQLDRTDTCSVLVTSPALSSLTPPVAPKIHFSNINDHI